MVEENESIEGFILEYKNFIFFENIKCFGVDCLIVEIFKNFVLVWFEIFCYYIK